LEHSVFYIVSDM